jgi:hypothetical protein
MKLKSILIPLLLFVAFTVSTAQDTPTQPEGRKQLQLRENSRDLRPVVRNNNHQAKVIMRQHRVKRQIKNNQGPAIHKKTERPSMRKQPAHQPTRHIIRRQMTR